MLFFLIFGLVKAKFHLKEIYDNRLNFFPCI